MDVKLTVVEEDIKAGLLSKPVTHFSAVATVVVNPDKGPVVTLHGTGLHVDQSVCEALAIASLKSEYALAFPPVKTVVVKTLDVDFS